MKKTMSRLFSAGRIGFPAGVLSLALGAAGCLPKKSDPVVPPLPPQAQQTPTQTATPPPVPIDPSKLISGEYDDAKAMKLVFGNYNASEKRSAVKLDAAGVKESGLNAGDDTKSLDVTASVYFSKPFRQLILDRRLLLFTFVPPNYDCHACAPSLGGALFSKVEGGWKLDSISRHILTDGAFGELPEPKMIKLGKERVGIAIETGFTSTGVTEGGLYLVAEVDGKLKEVFLLPEAFGDNGGNCGDDLGPCWSFESKFNYVPGGNDEWFDVVVATTGTEKNDKDEIVPVKKNRRFTFQNGKYQAGK